MSAERLSVTPPAQRRWRNFLLNPGFQLKYTGMVVLVTVAVAAVLGYFAYGYSKGQTESMMVTMAVQPDLAPDIADNLTQFAESEDRKVLSFILAGIALLALALAVTGIIVTHRVVGPAYKLKMLFGDIASGKLRLNGRIRRRDELQDVFVALEHMVEALREHQAREVAELDAAIEKAREAGVATSALTIFVDVRDRMQGALE